jgi:hypothetical protein
VHGLARHFHGHPTGTERQSVRHSAAGLAATTNLVARHLHSAFHGVCTALGTALCATFVHGTCTALHGALHGASTAPTWRLHGIWARLHGAVHDQTNSREAEHGELSQSASTDCCAGQATVSLRQQMTFNSCAPQYSADMRNDGEKYRKKGPFSRKR